MWKLAIIAFVVLDISLVDARSNRNKRQVYGPLGPLYRPGYPYIGVGSGIYEPLGLGSGFGQTHAMTNPNLALAHMRSRQDIARAQLVNNMAIQQAQINSAILNAQARANMAEAQARSLAIGK